MRTLWVSALTLAALTAVAGCKQKEPEPIPGPKAGVSRERVPGIAWFQGSLDEGFSRTGHHLSAPRRELRCAAPPPRPARAPWHA
jgi:hypothetical protein